MGHQVTYILRVSNLDLCRGFYRNLLKLGNPVTDSAFWVEFAVVEGFNLVLQHSSAPFLEHMAAAGSLMFKVDDIEAVVMEMKEHGYEVTPEEIEFHDGVHYRCLDPENNVIFLSASE